MKTSDIRTRFLNYFERQGHTRVASSSLVPNNDPTLLFTNAGMVQFKDVFLGRETRAYTRAVSSQRCVRAGGKHNDLENVGYTARHHTFFEMLGNFSFGEYFKRDAISFAWEFLTRELGLSKDKLWVTVFEEDDEAASIWENHVGLEAKRIIRIGSKDNFWQMGDTGPCGPCTEIFYDHGPSVPGGLPGSKDQDGDRYIEIWNLVFMQYNRDKEGMLHPLPRPSVDTGMGLERIAAVLQNVHSNYEIDLFQDLLRAAARETGTTDLASSSLRVIADHIRACCFLILDGVIPGNEGRGYVLRRIIRRASRHGYKLGQKAPFFHSLVIDLVAVMGEAYPELAKAAPRISDILRQEEERFAETLENGMAILDTAMQTGDPILDGEMVFTLYDTYGFPLDLTADIARERGYTVDFSGFERAMERQREQSRRHSKFSLQDVVSFDGQATVFHGYETLQAAATILAIYREGTLVNTIKAGDEAVIVLDETPFYAESGGQVGDQGLLHSTHAEFVVRDTQRIQAEVFGHKGVLATGQLSIGESVEAAVDAQSRRLAAYNHSATHLLHAALRKVLGEHVLQKGSLVDSERLRFDFAHSQAMTDEEIHEVEKLVNAEIRSNHAVDTRLMKYDEAVRCGAMALFGEKYGDEVRVISMGEFSTELCGGTHVGRTGDIGIFKIVGELAVASGIRRIEAVTAGAAVIYMQHQEDILHEVARNLKVQPQDVTARLSQILENVRQMEKDLGRLKARVATSSLDGLVKKALTFKGVKVLSEKIDGADAKILREVMDAVKQRLGSCVVVLASTDVDKVTLIAGVSSDMTERIKAGELVSFAASGVGGKGGGRADMAQAGGNQPDKLPAVLSSVPDWVRNKMA